MSDEPWVRIGEDDPYLPGGRHLCSEDEAMAWACEAGRRIGVTSVSDLTDTHGMRIPVTQAMRPATTGEVRTMGKGLTRSGAIVGALMEAVERGSAEVRPDSPEVTAAPDDMARVPLEFLHRPPDPPPPDEDTPWIVADVSGSCERRAVPLEMVTLDWVVPQPDWSGRFRATSNGLAAGFTRTSAVLQGLCEVVERDAMALWDLSGPDHQASTRIRPSTIRDARVQALLRAFVEAGLWVGVWNLTSGVGIPVIHAGTVARDPMSLGEGEVPAAGVGCHPDPVVATIRALCEAAQSRVSALHGMDEMDPDAYAQARELRAGALELLSQEPAADFADLENLSGEAPAAELETVEASVRRALGAEVLIVDLTRPGLPPVVKVMVPGTEASVRLPGWTPGPRARQILGEQPPARAAAPNRPSVIAPRLLHPVGSRSVQPVVFVHADRIPAELREPWAGVELRPAARPGDLVRAVEEGAAVIGLVDIDPKPRPRLRTSEALHVLRAGVPLVAAGGLGALAAHDLRALGAAVVGSTAEAATRSLVVHDNHLYRGDRSLDLPTLLATIEAARTMGLDSDIADAFAEAVAALPWRLRHRDRLWRALDADDQAVMDAALGAARSHLHDVDLMPMLATLADAPSPLTAAEIPAPTTMWAAALRWMDQPEHR